MYHVPDTHLDNRLFGLVNGPVELIFSSLSLSSMSRGSVVDLTSFRAASGLLMTAGTVLVVDREVLTIPHLGRS